VVVLLLAMGSKRTLRQLQHWQQQWQQLQQQLQRRRLRTQGTLISCSLCWTSIWLVLLLTLAQLVVLVLVLLKAVKTSAHQSGMCCRCVCVFTTTIDTHGQQSD
jgi:hypothetical protein